MKSLRGLFITITIGVTFLIFATVVGYNLLQFNQIISIEVQNQLKNQAEKEASKINSRLELIGRQNLLSGKNMEAMSKYDTNTIMKTNIDYIKLDPMILGAGFWMEPRKNDLNKEYFGPYAYKDNGNIKITWDYSNASYNYHQYDWYKNGLKAVDTVAWSEPYTDTVTGISMITSASAIVKNGIPIGVTTTDIDLKSIQDAVSQIKVGNTGNAFIITQQGFYLGSKDAEKNLKIKITEEKNESLRNVGKVILDEKKSGVIQTSIDGQSNYAVYAPLGDSGMKLVMLMPTSETTTGFNLTEFTIKNVGIFLVAMIILSILLSFLITKKIIIPLKFISKQTELIATGDLTVSLKEIDSKDEIGSMATAVSNLVSNLKNIIYQINLASKAVTETSLALSSNSQSATESTNIVAEAIQQVTHGSTKQASEITETVGVMSEVSTVIAQIATGAQDQSNHVVATINLVKEMVTKTDEMAEGMNKVKEISIQNGNTAENSGQAVLNTVNGMLQVKGAVSVTSQRIYELGEQSQKIGEIIQVIDDIAEQTNLLALNAAIEAARAGENGKGFAVVADEVRKLAERSGKATKEIAQLINDIQNGTKLAIESMEKGTKEVEQGVHVAQEAGESLKAIVNGVKIAEENVNLISGLINNNVIRSQEVAKAVNKVAAITEEHTAATEQISASTEQVNSAMENIAAISEENASTAEEVSASTEELLASIQHMSGTSVQLSQMSKELQQLVAKFRLQ